MTRSHGWVYPRGLIDPPGEIAVAGSPLRLYERGVWDPADQYWGEPDGVLEMCLVEVIVGGPRLQFEFEQVLPGGDDPDASDPILESIELRDSGQPARARALLEGLVELGRALSGRIRASRRARVRSGRCGGGAGSLCDRRADRGGLAA